MVIRGGGGEGKGERGGFILEDNWADKFACPISNHISRDILKLKKKKGEEKFEKCEVEEKNSKISILISRQLKIVDIGWDCQIVRKLSA